MEVFPVVTALYSVILVGWHCYRTVVVTVPHCTHVTSCRSSLLLPELYGNDRAQLTGTVPLPCAKYCLARSLYPWIVFAPIWHKVATAYEGAPFVKRYPVRVTLPGRNRDNTCARPFFISFHFLKKSPERELRVRGPCYDEFPQNPVRVLWSHEFTTSESLISLPPRRL